VGSALDTYLSAVNNRMNDVMTTLTIILAAMGLLPVEMVLWMRRRAWM
jgi:Mg2+ and Co2+ transporter CorA